MIDMKRKAFTLTEIVAVVVLMVLVSGVFYVLLTAPAKVNSYSQKEFDVQADMRYSSEVVNQHLKSATAAFLLTKNNEKFSDGWNYFLSEEKDGYSRLLLYEWDGSAHVKKLLSEFPSDNVKLSIAFQREKDGGMIKFMIDALDKQRNKKYNIESEVKVLNVPNIIDQSQVDYSLSPPQKRANCLAFRSDKPEPDLGSNGYNHISVSFVLDTSGSMTCNLAGDYLPASSTQKRRITMLKEAMVRFMDDIIAQDQAGIVDVRIYPFADFMAHSNKKFEYLKPSEWDSMVDESTTYSDYNKFFNVKKRGAGFLKGMVNSLATGMDTNLGDGLRFAHHGMLNYEKIMMDKGDSHKRIKHYLFVLTDGRPNHLTIGIREETKNVGGVPVLLEGLKAEDVFPGALPLYAEYPNGVERKIYFVKGPQPIVDGVWTVVPINKKAFVWDWYSYWLGESRRYEYVKLTCNLFRDYRTDFLKEPVDVTVVSFSNKSGDNEKCDMIGQNLGAPQVGGHYYNDCTTEDALKAVFESFTESILESASLWYVSGPQ